MDRVFRAWATPAGLDSFYIKECRTERPKDELVAASEPYHFYYVHAFDHDGQFLRVQENESLAHLRIDGGGGVVRVSGGWNQGRATAERNRGQSLQPHELPQLLALLHDQLEIRPRTRHRISPLSD